MKKEILACGAAALLSVSSLMAEDYRFVAFETVAGQTSTIDAVGLKAVVKDGKLVVTNGNDNREYQLSELGKMYFTNTSGIERIEPAEIDGPFEVFSYSGISLGRFADADEAIRSLAKGLYIIKIGTKTHSIAIR